MHFFIGRHELGEVAHLVQPLLVVGDTGLHQQTGDTVLHLHHLLDHQVPLSQRSSSVPDLRRGHVAFWQEITPHTVGDLAGIDPVVLLLGCGNGSEHQRMRHLHPLGVRKQMVIDPPGKDRRFHGDRAGLRHSPNPAVQFAAS